MKKVICILLFTLGIFKSYSQGLEYSQLVYYPNNTAKLGVYATFSWGTQTCCPILDSYDTLQQTSDTLGVYLFYNTSFACPTMSCAQKDTIWIGNILTGSLKAVKLYLYMLTYDSATGWDTTYHQPADVILPIWPVSVKDAPANYDVSIHPNPNNGSFTLQGNINTEILQLEIVNTVGQVVYKETEKVTSNTLYKTITLDESLPAGVYLLRLQSENGIHTMRLVLER